MPELRIAALAGSLALILTATPALAQAGQPQASGRDRSGYATGFVMIKGRSRLPEVPVKLVTLSVPFEPAYFAAATVSHVAVPRFVIPIPFTGASLKGNSLDLEAQLGQHFGRQHNAEADVAAVLRSGQFGLFDGLSANVAWGNGFSYALGRPRAEIGRGGAVGVDNVRFQYHMSFETELTTAASRHVHLVLRLHHRSGIYGVISPSKTGSNYFGAGLRFDFGRR